MSDEITHIGDLTPDPNNARLHNPRNVGMIADGLNEVGAARSIVIDENGVILAGNATIEAAAQAGIENVQVVKADGNTVIAVQRTGLTDEQKVLLALLDNRTTDLSEFDPVQIEKLMIELDTDFGEIWYEGELEELLADVREPEPVADPGAQIDRAAELQVEWGTERGQVWTIPSVSVPDKSHRIMCGDSTDADDVARLMGGEKAEMIWTDPPYGVAVGDKNKWLNSIARSNRVEDNLDGDTLDEEGLMAMLESAFDNAIAHCALGGAWYVAAPPGPLQVLFGQALKVRGIWRQTIQWVKNNATFSPMGVDYHWQAEPLFYGWLPGAGHRYYGGRKQTTVWEIDRPLKSPEHPTMKPIELVARAIGNSSKSGELVLDLYLGSGTTLIASEQTARIGYGCEISPGYVAVALQRLQDAGLTPALTEQAD